MRFVPPGQRRSGRGRQPRHQTWNNPRSTRAGRAGIGQSEGSVGVLASSTLPDEMVRRYATAMGRCFERRLEPQRLFPTPGDSVRGMWERPRGITRRSSSSSGGRVGGGRDRCVQASSFGGGLGRGKPGRRTAERSSAGLARRLVQLTTPSSCAFQSIAGEQMARRLHLGGPVIRGCGPVASRPKRGGAGGGDVGGGRGVLRSTSWPLAGTIRPGKVFHLQRAHWRSP